MSVRNLSNEKLMLMYSASNMEAFEELYSRYNRRIFSYFLKKTGSHEVAHDLTQDFFSRIHTNRDKYSPNWKLDTWFFTIAKNLFLNHMKHSSVRRHEDFNGDDHASPNKEEAVNTMFDLEEALKELPEEQRDIFEMKYFKNLSYDSIAEETGKKSDNIRKIVSRTISFLKKRF